jgi:ribonuclease P protein component
MHTFTKEERLCSKKIIGELFSNKGVKHITQFPLMAIWKKTDIPTTLYPAQVLFSIPKKKFKKAHDRNRLRRQVRESYRNQKSLLYDILSVKRLQCAIVMVYIAQEKLPFAKIDHACRTILQNIADNTE